MHTAEKEDDLLKPDKPDKPDSNTESTRFPTPLKSNLTKLRHNLYLNQSDPMYYEKFIRYSDAQSPEAHYMIAQKFEKEGFKSKAIAHYQEAAVSLESPYYVKAKQGIRRIINVKSSAAVNITQKPSQQTTDKIPKSIKWVFIWLILLNLLLILSLLTINNIRNIMSSDTKKQMNSTLLGIGDATVDLSTSSSDSQQKIYAYNPLDSESLIYVATNLVRTALHNYKEDKGAVPQSITSLVGVYPNNYLTNIPQEFVSKSNQIVAEFDGSGGWVYRPLANSWEDKFYPNIISEDFARQISYNPIEIVISQKDYLLTISSGKTIIASRKVGLGREGRTPEGNFKIQDRVLNPKGKQLNAYGVAGLGMGQYAIHGTNDATSIGANASLGCIRLSNEDILTIFPLVPKGTAVRIASHYLITDQKNLTLDIKSLFPTFNPQTNVKVSKQQPSQQPIQQLNKELMQRPKLQAINGSSETQESQESLELRESPFGVIFSWLG